MRKFSHLLVTSGLIAALLPLSAAAETIRDTTLAFSIEFPGDAEREQLDDDLPDWVHRVAAWEQSDGGYFNAMAVQTLPDNYVYNDLAAVFADARAECQIGGAVVSERRFDVPGGMGGEVLTYRHELSGKIFDLVRFAAKKNKIYCVRATWHDGEDPAAARAFVQSFRVL